MFAEFLQKYKLLLGLGVLLLAANTVVLFTLSLPKINAEAIARQRLESAMQRQDALRARLAGLADEKNALAAARGDIESFYGETLGNRNRQIEVIRERNEIASSFGVLPTRVNYTNDVEEGQPVERFTMSFPLQGNYASLRFFLNTIERSNNFLIIDGVELEGSGEERELSMRITVTTYFYHPSEEGKGAIYESP